MTDRGAQLTSVSILLIGHLTANLQLWVKLDRSTVYSHIRHLIGPSADSDGCTWLPRISVDTPLMFGCQISLPPVQLS